MNLHLNYILDLEYTDLSDHFSNLDELEEFLINKAPIDYLGSSMCELSILNLIEKSLVENQKEKEDLLEIKSLSDYAGFSYPSNTCPIIDKEKSSLESELIDYETEKESLENEINEIEKTLEDPTCYSNEEIEELQSKVEELETKIEEVESDLEKMEELRTSCENVREEIIKNNTSFKEDIQLYVIVRDGITYHLLDIPEYSVDDLESTMDDVFCEPDFVKADLDSAIRNLKEIYEMGKNMGDFLENEFKMDILRFSHTYDRNEFVKEFLADIINKKTK